MSRCREGRRNAGTPAGSNPVPGTKRHLQSASAFFVISWGCAAVERVLYELHINYVDGLFLLIPLVLSVVFFLTGRQMKNNTAYQPWKRRLGGLVFQITALVMLVVFLFTMGSSVLMYAACRRLWKRGEVSEVTGYVENYHPMPASGHDMESFEIDGVSFSYSNFVLQTGYHCAASWGGVVTHDGQHLKIQYIQVEEEKIIVYIAELT